MSVIIRTDLPLEVKLHSVAASPSVHFPDRNSAYWTRYVQIKQWIADEYYQSAGAGLALQGERYTRHDISHVDDVIDTAGYLLGYNSGVSNSIFDTLSPYETYVLLLAILLHDAGNARHREKHEKQPRAIIARMGGLARFLSSEIRLISQIAEAHGGRTNTGSKDTIRDIILADVTSIGPIEVRARMLAAALRFADELSENPHRADPQALIKPYTPPQSAIHNLFCTVINNRIEYSARTIYMNFNLTTAQLDEEFAINKTGKKKVLLVDYIVDRVEKCNRERLYCNRFLFPWHYDKIRVTLEIHDEEDVLKDRLSLELADEGYPGATRSLKSYEPGFDGQKLREKFVGALAKSGGSQ